MSRAHVGGAVPISSPSYIERRFEVRARSELLAGRWVLLLGPRQHGKTSGLLRLRDALTQSGLECGYVDLQSAPPATEYGAYLTWLVGRVARSLGREIPADDGTADALDLPSRFGAAVGSGAAPIVVIVDEASAVPPEWRNVFYGQLRALANEAAVADPASIASRIRCVFAGTFRPETLVDDLNSPFNVCQRIDTEDLSADDAARLWEIVVGEERHLASMAFEVVGGQPYLLQKVMDVVAGAEGDRSEALARALDELRMGSDDHFEGVFGRILAEPRLATSVATMARCGEVALSPADPDARYLITIGVARRDGRRLVFRNAIYQQFAATSPQLIGDAAPLLPPIGAVRLVATPPDAFLAVQDRRLREFAETSAQAATIAYNAGAFRPALVGFGAALEALLADFLLGIGPGDLAAAVVRATDVHWERREDPLKPLTWRLVNMIRVSRRAPARTVAAVDPPDALREWRNLVHPAVALDPYRLSSEMEPEARTASGLLAGLLRDLA